MKRIGILVVAYNAASTLASVLDRIPDDFVPRVAKVLVSDDYSHDATYLVGLGYQQLERCVPARDHPPPEQPRLRRQPEGRLPLGDRAGPRHRRAAARRRSVRARAPARDRRAARARRVRRGVRLAHDGQGRGARGGMPLYKYVGNRILTQVRERGGRASISPSGTRATARYSVAALQEIPFERNSDGFDFDTEIILQLHEAGKRIVEIPIPTYYGDEICYVNGLSYARDVVRDVLRYRAHKIGFGTGEMAFATHDDYELKHADETSHRRIVQWFERKPPSRVLDLGCADGRLGGAAARVRPRRDRRRRAQGRRRRRARRPVLRGRPRRGIPDEVGDGYDVVLAADVLEHVRDPQRLLRAGARPLQPHGTVDRERPELRALVPACARSRSAASTTTGAASSTSATCGSSPGRSFERVAKRRGLHGPAPGDDRAAARGVVSRGGHRTKRPGPSPVWARSNASPSTSGRRCSDSSSSTSSNRPVRTSDATE